MKSSYSPEVDILKVAISEGEYGYGEDNEGIIVYHATDGTPLSLEVLDGRLFVMFANASLVTGREVTNPAVSGIPYTRSREVPVRAIPRGDADLRFKYDADSDTLAVRFGNIDSSTRRRNHQVTVYYDQDELPTGLEIWKACEFVLGIMQSVLLHEEVSFA